MSTQDPRDDIPEPKQEVSGPLNALAEQTLAVDLARAEIDQLIATAHRFPRKIKLIEEQIAEMALHNEAAADHCVYALPRGGKAIVGPSIGFANIVASAWGNCWDYGRWIHTDRKEKVVVAEGIFVDWQTNRRLVMTEQRRIVTSQGYLYNDDMIIVTSKAAASIARRNVILNAVSRALWWPTYERALYMVRGSETTLPDRRDKAMKALIALGAQPKSVLMYLGVPDIKEIGIEHMPTLRGMYQQLRDGAITVEEMFDPRRMTGTGFDKVENPLSDGDEDEQPERTSTPPKATGKPADAQKQTEATQEAKDEKNAPAATRKRGRPPKAKPEAEPQGGDEGTEIQHEDPPSEDAKTEPKAQQDDPPAQVAQPRNATEYRAHAEAYIAAATSASELENKWKSKEERDLRTVCGMVEEDFTSLRAACFERVAALRASS